MSQPNIVISQVSITPNPIETSKTCLISVKVDAQKFEIATISGFSVTDQLENVIICKEE